MLIWNFTLFFNVEIYVYLLISTHISRNKCLHNKLHNKRKMFPHQKKKECIYVSAYNNNNRSEHESFCTNINFKIDLGNVLLTFLFSIIMKTKEKQKKSSCTWTWNKKIIRKKKVSRTTICTYVYEYLIYIDKENYFLFKRNSFIKIFIFL